MSDVPTPAGPVLQSQTDSVKLVYVLYFLGYVTGIAIIAGLIVAYLKREGADPVAASHFRFQIRTFWIGLLYSAIGALLFIIAIGWLIWLFTIVWSLIRNIKGFLAISENKPIADPATWLW